MKLVIEEKFIDAVAEMLYKQQEENLEQFATMTGVITDQGLEVENFELWDNSDLEQTPTTVSPNNSKKWESIGDNMKFKGSDFIITLHTHPEFYGTNPHGLDESDQRTFKKWTKNLDNFGNRLCINGIVTEKDGFLFTYYDVDHDIFREVSFSIVPNKVSSYENDNRTR